MASERFEGIVNELARTGAGQEEVITFWLVAGDGTGALVKTRQDWRIRNGDHISVLGERDSDGTLAADSVEVRKTPDSRAQPLQWGRIVASILLSAFISAVVGLAFFQLFLPNMFWHISWSQGIFRAIDEGIIRFILVLFVLTPAVLVAFPLVCSMAITSKMVSYRPGPHALIAAPITLPVFILFLQLLSWLLYKN